MNLARFYPSIYWNTANLIVDSASFAEDLMESEELEEDDETEEETKAKKSNKTVDYGKISSAIGRFKTYGIKVLPPDINFSKYTFTPDEKKNTITYGLRGITRISNDLIKEIINNRPFNSSTDFFKKIKTNKTQAINLIKAGCFDEIDKIPREKIMLNYINSIAEKKERLTLQNMQALIDYELIPEEKSFYASLFLFNKFLKKNKNGDYYILNQSAVSFIDSYFDFDIIIDGDKILQKDWDKIYKKEMEGMRDYLKENKEIILNKLNQCYFDELWEKYALGNLSKWEMESLSFYYHEHELDFCKNQYDNFFELPEDPVIIDSFIAKTGKQINTYRLYTIAGTVINKDKGHNTITLLTPQGVVNVKIYKNQFAQYNKQLSAINEEGEKKVLEKSWFNKGTLLIIQGFRRGQDFIPKKTKYSSFPIITKIVNIDKNNNLELQYERLEVGD